MEIKIKLKFVSSKTDVSCKKIEFGIEKNENFRIFLYESQLQSPIIFVDFQTFKSKINH